MHDAIWRRRVSEAHECGEREALAAVWPELMEYLGRFPPTRAEIERILVSGPPSGFSYLPNSHDRWQFRTRGFSRVP